MHLTRRLGWGYIPHPRHPLCVLFNTTLRTPKHEGLYRYGRRCGLRAGGQYGAHLDLWGVTVELRALAISLCVDASRRSLPGTGTSIACSIAGASKAVLARGRRYRVHVHMYTCTVCAWRFTQTLSPQRVGYGLMLCLDPGLNPITNDQTPVVPFCYRIINVTVELNATVRLRSAQSLSIFRSPPPSRHKDHSPHNNDVGF
jgi:hypothetical protein